MKSKLSFDIYIGHNQNNKTWIGLTTIITLMLFSTIMMTINENWGQVQSIVVDGNRSGPSAFDNQSYEEDMIDNFNVKSCGIADPDIYENGFISHAKQGEYPWMVSIQMLLGRDGEGGPMHFCCGSFISSKWILTAAHCIDSTFVEMFRSGRYRIVAGTTEVYSKTNQIFKARNIYVHSRFRFKVPIGFDIALIELENPPYLSDKRPLEENVFNHAPGERKPMINALCLPLGGKNFNPGETVRLVGWGASEFNNTQSAATKLLHTDVQLADTDSCVNSYASRPKLVTVKKHWETYKDLLCTVGGKRDACQGDSGSSMIEYSGGKAVSVGIVSYGIRCATEVPGVFTKTSSYLPWIKDITMNKGKATTDYRLISPDEQASS